MKKYMFLLGLNFWCLATSAQLSKVNPSKPNVKDTITISYNTKLPNAKLNGQEEIYARITSFMQDGSIQKSHKPLMANTKELSCKFVIAPLAAFVKIEFYTLNKDDDEATQKIIVYNEGRQKPVQGAYLNDLYSDQPDSIFQLELANYPNHYYAYARYINVVSLIKDPILSKVQIKTLLDKLNQIAMSNKNDVGLMTALCVGNAKIGALALAKQKLNELLDTYPLAAETAFAFSIYNYEYYKTTSKSIEDEIKAKLKYIYKNFPNAAICKDMNVFEALRKEKDISTLAFENVFLPLYSNAEIAYYALGNLPELYIERNENLAVAKSLLTDGIKQFQDGQIQHQYRLDYRHYQMYVPLLLLSLTKINVAEKDSQQAIINSSAAMQILIGSNLEGNLLPSLLQLRSQAYTDLGNFNLALADYEKLYLTGNTNALDSMKRLFPLSNAKAKSFNEYLIALKPATGKENLMLQKLANFTGTDLKGNQISLNDLKGKIVVLNVWGIGCGPCIAEMSSLNQLVKEYATEPNVVFIAITNDESASLINFLKVKQFDYKIVNNVAKTSTIFNTSALPVHLVIGKNGEILHRSIGAREDIKAFLSGIINANL